MLTEMKQKLIVFLIFPLTFSLAHLLYINRQKKLTGNIPILADFFSRGGSNDEVTRR